jgi:hypothetical protein
VVYELPTSSPTIATRGTASALSTMEPASIGRHYQTTGTLQSLDTLADLDPISGLVSTVY